MHLLYPKPRTIKSDGGPNVFTISDFDIPRTPTGVKARGPPLRFAAGQRCAVLFLPFAFVFAPVPHQHHRISGKRDHAKNNL